MAGAHAVKDNAGGTTAAGGVFRLDLAPQPDLWISSYAPLAALNKLCTSLVTQETPVAECDCFDCSQSDDRLKLQKANRIIELETMMPKTALTQSLAVCQSFAR